MIPTHEFCVAVLAARQTLFVGDDSNLLTRLDLRDIPLSSSGMVVAGSALAQASPGAVRCEQQFDL